MSDKARSSRMPLVTPPPGKHMMPTRAEEASPLERGLLGGLDREKLSDLAEVLFALNNNKHGPVPGFYVVVSTKADKEWCVGQLNADRAKPFILFNDKVFSSPEEAQKEAEKIKKDRGESAPRRCT